MVNLLLERTAVDTATSVSGRKPDLAELGGGNASIVVGDIGTVSRHAGVASIEDGGVERVRGILAPVPVRLVALVAAFVAEGLLVGPGEVPVPGEEVSLFAMLDWVVFLHGACYVELTVPWMDMVWLMCTATKSS